MNLLFFLSLFRKQMGADRKGNPDLYLPKRSTVLVLCFILCTLTSAQYHILDGIMDALLKDEGNEII